MTRLLAAFYWGVLGMLLLPLGLLALASLSDRAAIAFPLGAPTLRWYREALADPDFHAAFARSTALAAGAAAIAVTAGTAIALAAATAPRALSRLLIGAALLPLATPGLIHAVALRTSLPVVGLDPGVPAMLLGHAIHATPYAVITVAARRRTLPLELLEAARDLGAGPAATFRAVVLPWLRPALFGAAVLAALSSFDDFVRSFFLGGYDATLPVLVFGRLRSGLTPALAAISTLVLLAACLLGAAVGRVRR